MIKHIALFVFHHVDSGQEKNAYRFMEVMLICYNVNDLWRNLHLSLAIGSRRLLSSLMGYCCHKLGCCS